MKIKQFSFNPFGENTYLLYDKTKECVIIDPGCFSEEEKQALKDYIETNELKVVRLLNTHLHCDHAVGNDFVESQYGVRTEAHKDDEFLLPQIYSHMLMFGVPVDVNQRIPSIAAYLSEGDIVSFGNQKLEVIHVPGHSPGSVVFYSRDDEFLIVGDVLFRRGIGRTDLPGGDYNQLIDGIKNKLYTLSPRTAVYPGHGPSTTIGEEIRLNPFVRG